MTHCYTRLLALVALGMLMASGQAFAQTTTDYDTDNDGLIDITTLAQLNVIRWDVNGDGAIDFRATTADTTAYNAAFSNRVTTSSGRMGCPSGTCTGYELMNSLDFDENADDTITVADAAYWDGGAGWDPIGTSSFSYSGTFKGNGYTINNLFINRSSNSNSGLFASVVGGRIETLGITNANVRGRDQSGILSGSGSGTFVACYTTGTMQGALQVGGIVGKLQGGTILSSYSTASVSGTNDVGGLVGQSAGGTLTATYATGSVSRSSGTLTNIGGLIGLAISSTETASYWDTETSGQSTSAGGSNVVGKTTSELQSPTTYTGIYAVWNTDVDGDRVPDNPWNFGTASEYPTLKTSSQQQEPAIDYDSDNDGLIDITTLAQLNAIRYDLNGDGLPTGTNADTAAYAGAFPRGDITSSTGRMGCPATGCTGYELGSRPRPLHSPNVPGGYPEAEIAHLVNLDFDENNDNRISSADSYYWNGGAGWEPIGTSTDSFTAIFNGNNNFIFRLFINRETTDDVGLFGFVGNTARIDSLNLAVDVTGRNNVGGLVGRNNGTISACVVTGRVTALGDAVGGLIGNNSNTVTVSHTRMIVRGRGSEGVGGLIGSNSGMVTASYTGGYSSRVEVLDRTSASSKIGGLIGNNSGTVTASYSTSYLSFYKAPVSISLGSLPTVADPTEVGGLIGSNSGTVTASYWDTETSGRTSSDGGTGQTTTALQEVTSATGIYSAWDDMTLDASGTSDDDPWHFGTQNQYPVLQFGGLLTNRQFANQPIDYDTDDDGLIDITTITQLNAMRFDVNGDGLADISSFLVANPRTAAVIASQYNLAFPKARAEKGCPTTGCKGYELTANLSFDRNGDGGFSALDTQEELLGVPLYYDYIFAQRNFYSWLLPNEFNMLSETEQARHVLIVDTYGFLSARYNFEDSWLPINVFDVYNDSEGWEPIEHFAAIFKGNDHTISHFFIYRPGESNVGLFANTTADARIDSVKLTQARVTGLDNVGGLIGYNRGNVTACSVIGTGIKGRDLVTGASYIGGLIGYNDGGKVTDSYAAGAIKGNTGSYVGGLIGSSENGKIIDSHAAGSIKGRYSNYIGGLVGGSSTDTITACYATNNISTFNAGFGALSGGLVGDMTDGLVTASYATGSISGAGDYVGGLIGVNASFIDTSKVIASYSTGVIHVFGKYVGGLIGSNDDGKVTASYTTSTVIVPSDTLSLPSTGFINVGGERVQSDGYLIVSGKHVGGLIGEHIDYYEIGEVTDSYWDTEFTLIPDDADNNAPEGKTPTQLTSPTGYTGIYSNWNVDLDSTTGGDNPWAFGSNTQYPVLRYSRTQEEINAQFTAQLWRFSVQDVEVTTGIASLIVSWTRQVNAIRYKVQWKSGNENYDSNTRQAIVSTGTSYTIPNLINGTTYTIRVIATISSTLDGSPSWEVTGTPSKVQGVEVIPGPASLIVSWTGLAGASGYKVQWKSGNENYDSNTRQAIVSTGTSYAIPNLIDGTTYTVRVIATIDTGDGTPSQEVTGTPDPEARPESPADLPAPPDPPDPDTEPTFGEAVDPQSYWKDKAIEPLILPAATDGNGDLTYSLTELPEGLTFDAETRELSGTPTEATEKAIYTLTVTDEDGDADAMGFFLTIIANVAPSFGDANVAAQAYTRKQEITSLTLPQVTDGDEPLTYALTPDLPEGLNFDAETRVLSGTPLEATDETTYTLTATDNDSDEATLMFTIQVTTDPIPTFGDTIVAAQSYLQHREIESLTLPQASGGDEPLTHALIPALPEGLTFDVETLTVSGTPSKAMDETTYTLTATDDNGDEAHLLFTLEVPDLVPAFGDSTIAAQSYLVNQEIASLTFPQATGGDGLLVYILLPFLPEGLSFDPTTRTLSGLPLKEMAEATYTLSALDADGDTASLTFTLEISLPSPDFDGDGVVNFADFLTFAGKFGSRFGQERYDARYDLNSDGQIDFDDFLIFADSFGSTG